MCSWSFCCLEKNVRTKQENHRRGLPGKCSLYFQLIYPCKIVEEANLLFFFFFFICGRETLLGVKKGYIFLFLMSFGSLLGYDVAIHLLPVLILEGKKKKIKLLIWWTESLLALSFCYIFTDWYLVTFWALLSGSWNKRVLVRQVKIDGSVSSEFIRHLQYICLGAGIFRVIREQNLTWCQPFYFYLLSWSSGMTTLNDEVTLALVSVAVATPGWALQQWSRKDESKWWGKGW